MRAWSVVGRGASTRTQLAYARRLATRYLSPAELYRDTAGFAFRIDPEDPFQAAMLLGLFDRQTGWMMRRYARPGTVAIDVGAHLGYFSLRLARLVGPTGAVHSFEPDPRLCPRLREHVQANALDGTVTVNEVGLLDRPVEGQPLLLRPQLGWASVVSPSGPGADRFSAQMITLDDYVKQADIDPVSISVIKIDVEGAELAVLKGGRETLAASSAAVLVEHVADRAAAAGQNKDAVPVFLEELGFKAYVPMRKRGRLALAPGTDPNVGIDVLFLRRQG
jgi:FkbM family methyltransferase